MPFCQRSSVIEHAVSQPFLQFILKFQQILPPAPERVPATPLFQAHSWSQDERHRAAASLQPIAWMMVFLKQTRSRRGPALRQQVQSWRDRLSQPLHPGPWRLEERAIAASATHTRHASFTPSHAEDGYSRQDHWHRLDSRAACLSGRSSRPGSLGRRLAHRQPQQPDCNTGGTSYALRHADQGEEQRHQDRH